MELFALFMHKLYQKNRIRLFNRFSNRYCRGRDETDRGLYLYGRIARLCAMPFLSIEKSGQGICLYFQNRNVTSWSFLTELTLGRSSGQLVAFVDESIWPPATLLQASIQCIVFSCLTITSLAISLPHGIWDQPVVP